MHATIILFNHKKHLNSETVILPYNYIIIFKNFIAKSRISIIILGIKDAKNFVWMDLRSIINP